MRWVFLLTIAAVSGCGEKKPDMQEFYRASYTQHQEEWVRNASAYSLLKEHPELCHDVYRAELMEATKKKCLDACGPWGNERRRFLHYGGDGGWPANPRPSATTEPPVETSQDPTT